MIMKTKTALNKGFMNLWILNKSTLPKTNIIRSNNKMESNS